MNILTILLKEQRKTADRKHGGFCIRVFQHTGKIGLENGLIDEGIAGLTHIPVDRLNGSILYFSGTDKGAIPQYEHDKLAIDGIEFGLGHVLEKRSSVEPL